MSRLRVGQQNAHISNAIKNVWNKVGLKIAKIKPNNLKLTAQILLANG